MADFLSSIQGSDALPTDTKRLFDVNSSYSNMGEDEKLFAQIENAKADALKQNKLYSSEADGNSIVPVEDKDNSKEIIKGGRNMFRGTKSPSKYRKSVAAQGKTMKAYDFYRDGYLEDYELPGKNLDGTTNLAKRYKPMPELVSSISDDWKGALASIKLVDTSAIRENAPGDSNSGEIIPQYTKFFLESISEQHQEKVQLVETFNDFYVFFYGEKPPIYTFSGHLLNLSNYNWMNEFTYYYQNFWRGTKAVELGARVFLTYNYQQVQGYIMSMNTNIQAVTDKAAPFSFQFIVTKRIIFNQASTETIFSDSLLPNPSIVDKSGVGAIDTEHAKFSTALLTDYLEGDAPASSLSNQSIKDIKNSNKAKKKKFADQLAQQRQERLAAQEARELAEKRAKEIPLAPTAGAPSFRARRVSGSQADNIKRGLGFPVTNDTALG